MLLQFDLILAGVKGCLFESYGQAESYGQGTLNEACVENFLSRIGSNFDGIIFRRIV
jgi:hypothetical protein